MVFIAVSLFLMPSCTSPRAPDSEPGDNGAQGESWNGESDQLMAGSPRGQFSNDGDQVFNSLAVCQEDPEIVFVGSETSGVFRSTDGGQTWEWLRKGIRWLPVGPAGERYGNYPEVYDLMILPGDASTGNQAQTVLALTTNGPGPATGEYPSALAGFYKSYDGGDTWVQKSEGLINAGLTRMAPYPGDTPAILAVTGTGRDPAGRLFEAQFYRSTDEGETWTPLDIPPELSRNALRGLIVRGENPPMVFVAALSPSYWSEETRDEAEMFLMRSPDAGQTWTVINPPGSYLMEFDVSPGNPDLIYAANNQFQVLRSADGGESWEVAVEPAGGPVRVSPFDDQTVFFTRDGNLLRSTDGLETYTVVLEGDEWIQDIETCRAAPQVVYVASMGLLVYKSTDGGASFELMANLRQYVDEHAGDQTTDGGD